MNRSKVGLLGLALMVGVAACDDDATGPESSLTQAEAAALAAVLLDQTMAAGDPDDVATQQVHNPLLAAAVVDFDDELDFTIQCPMGGAFSANRVVSGTMDTETGEMELEFSLVQTHDACGVNPEELDGTVTLTGAPDVTSSWSLSTDANGGFDASGSIMGAIDWVYGDRSGTCEVSLEFSGAGDGLGAFQSSLNGSICLATISQSVTVTP